MPNVLILIESESAIAACMASALMQAVQAADSVEIVAVDQFKPQLHFDIVCPLTLTLPEKLDFPQLALYKRCGAIEQVRSTVANLDYATGKGSYWLPIVLTAKGPLYGEAIAQDTLAAYRQPIHFSDAIRQPLYRLGFRVLESIQATPAVYLMQFGIENQEIVFDRVFPFPAAPAIATLNVQSPDLFACHWYCLNRMPILDLTINQAGSNTPA